MPIEYPACLFLISYHNRWFFLVSTVYSSPSLSLSLSRTACTCCGGSKWKDDDGTILSNGVQKALKSYFHFYMPGDMVHRLCTILNFLLCSKPNFFDTQHLTFWCRLLVWELVQSVGFWNVDYFFYFLSQKGRPDDQ